MPRKTVSEEDKIQFNELYLKYGTYAEVARQTGFSASTVRRYIVSNYVPQETLDEIKIKFTKNIDDLKPKFDFPKSLQEWQLLFEYTEEEKQEIEELRKEINI